MFSVIEITIAKKCRCAQNRYLAWQARQLRFHFIVSENETESAELEQSLCFVRWEAKCAIKTIMTYGVGFVYWKLIFLQIDRSWVMYAL